MWMTSGRASGRKTLLQYSSLAPLERECYEGEVQPYRKTDYKPMMMIFLIFWKFQLIIFKINKVMVICFQFLMTKDHSIWVKLYVKQQGQALSEYISYTSL